jgi:hypothetical protein
MIYTCPTHVFVTDTHLLKLLHQQNKVVRSMAVSTVHTDPCDMILLQNDVHGIQMKREIGEENTFS